MKIFGLRHVRNVAFVFGGGDPLLGTLAGAGFTLADDAVRKIRYVGAKRYVRLTGRRRQ